MLKIHTKKPQTEGSPFFVSGFLLCCAFLVLEPCFYWKQKILQGIRRQHSAYAMACEHYRKSHAFWPDPSDGRLLEITGIVVPYSLLRSSASLCESSTACYYFATTDPKVAFCLTRCSGYIHACTHACMHACTYTYKFIHAHTWDRIYIQATNLSHNPGGRGRGVIT